MFLFIIASLSSYDYTSIDLGHSEFTPCQYLCNATNEEEYLDEQCLYRIVGIIIGCIIVNSIVVIFFLSKNINSSNSYNLILTQ
jgi:hypothetical protein